MTYNNIILKRFENDKITSYKVTSTVNQLVKKHKQVTNEVREYKIDE